ELNSIGDDDSTSNAQNRDRPSSPLRPNPKYCTITEAPRRPAPRPVPAPHPSDYRHNREAWRDVPRQNTHGLAAPSPVSSRPPEMVTKIADVARSEMEVDGEANPVERPSSPLKPNEKYCSIPSSARRPTAVARVAPRRASPPSLQQQLQRASAYQQSQNGQWNPNDQWNGWSGERTGDGPPPRPDLQPRKVQQRLQSPLLQQPQLDLQQAYLMHQRSVQQQQRSRSQQQKHVQHIQQPHLQHTPPSQPDYAAYSHNPYGANYLPLDGGFNRANYDNHYHPPPTPKHESMEEEECEVVDDDRKGGILSDAMERHTKNARRRQKKEDELRRLEEERIKLREERLQLERVKREAEVAARLEEAKKRNEQTAKAKFESFSFATKLKKEEEHGVVTMSKAQLEALQAQWEARGQQNAQEQRATEARSRMNLLIEMRGLREPEPMEVEESDAIESSIPCAPTTVTPKPKPLRTKQEPVADESEEPAAGMVVKKEKEDEEEKAEGKEKEKED
ncbi:hypothetical protein PFISCL1PPCAC_9861, partial [Pristionchus fissidentatus]